MLVLVICFFFKQSSYRFDGLCELENSSQSHVDLLGSLLASMVPQRTFQSACALHTSVFKIVRFFINCVLVPKKYSFKNCFLIGFLAKNGHRMALLWHHCENHKLELLILV